MVTACHSYAGEYPGERDHAARERMFFAAEGAIHEGLLEAYALAHLPPEAGVTQTDGDRRTATASTRMPRDRELGGGGDRPTP